MTDKSELFPDVTLPEAPLVEPAAPAETVVAGEVQGGGAPAVTPAPVAPEVAPTPAPAALVVPPGYVPIDVLLRTRDEAKAAKGEAARLQAERDADLRKRREQAAKAPDPLEDPEGFVRYQHQQLRAVEENLSRTFEQRLAKTVEAQSRAVMEDHLGEGFAKLAKFIDEAPDEMHAMAWQKGAAHPYRWFHQQMLAAEKAQRAEALAAQVGDKSIDDIVAERVAAALAERDAQAVETSPTVTRGPDGKFASPSQSQPQRRSAPSLVAVNGAAASTTEPASVSGLDALLHRG